ncbi:uncharacterized protein BJX67DRAFT_318599 [Aspergillus lucknowensis]|uniref:Uncharacterized protein n=1 Tax=Aspergillus lucknowensis TaxID=176173 RepID=A0ABR4L8T6_9EURO
MQTRSTKTSHPPQPPKESTYTQHENPISHNPSEIREQRQQQEADQHQHRDRHRHRGDAPERITRGASSLPSTDASASVTNTAQHRREQREGDIDPEYGVEQQPDEGAIARAVGGQSRHRGAQAGAHAGPVGSARGPGAPGFGEGDDTMADLDRKAEGHRRILGERVGRTPPVPDGETVEREALRERKLREDTEVRPAEVVGEVTGKPVVGR